MTVERRHLSSGNHQQAVEVRLQLPHRIILRGRVVVRDRNEVQPLAHRRIDYHKDRPRHLRPSKALARAVAVRGVHMQIAPEPSITGAYWPTQHHGLVLNETAVCEE